VFKCFSVRACASLSGRVGEGLMSVGIVRKWPQVGRVMMQTMSGAGPEQESQAGVAGQRSS